MTHIDGIQGMVAGYIASPQGKQMIRNFLTSPEGQEAIDSYLSTPEGQEMAKLLLAKALCHLDMPEPLRDEIRKALGKADG